MKRALESIGVVAANDIAIEVGRIEGAGGQMTTDGARRRTPGGVFWALLKETASKDDWDFIFEEEKEVQRERCRRRRRAMSMAASSAGTSLVGSPSFRSLAGTPGASFLRTPAHGLISAAAATISAAAGAGANVHKTPAGAAGAPSRPTLAERLSGAAGAAEARTSGGSMASRLRNVQDTPLGATAPEGSWAARAKAAAMNRTQSAPAAVLASAAVPYSPAAAAAALSLTSPAPARAAALAAAAPASAPRGSAMESSPAYGVVTPDNDPSAAAPGGTWAARAKAAAEADVGGCTHLTLYKLNSVDPSHESTWFPTLETVK
jgi:hypothetical protein